MTTGPGGNGVVGVLPDLTGLDRVFQYRVPDSLAAACVLGAMVRVRLQGRRVRGWIVEVGLNEDRELLEIEEITSLGPDASLLDIGRFGAWRYAGRLRPFLVAASPPRPVRELEGVSVPRQSPPVVGIPEGAQTGQDPIAEATGSGLAAGIAVLRLPPASPRLAVVEAAVANRGPGVLVLVPERRDVEILTGRLVRDGVAAVAWPEQWAEAAAGVEVVVGTRTAALARLTSCTAIVVLDAHAEAYVSERAPTWSATVLAVERARRSGVPCLLVSPCPGPSLLSGAELVTLGRGGERSGWPVLELLDRRGDDPRTGLYAPRLASLIRAALDADRRRPVLCVLNRTGRARLLACGSCGELARCEHCGAAVRQLGQPEPGEPGLLSCPSCGNSRPLVCAECGSTRLKLLRVGVQRAAEELAALVGEEVEEVAGRGTGEQPGATGSRLLVGTEAVLHRVRSASLVVFLDFDQELLAPRYRAGEQALALLALAARLVGGRRGTVAIQTRLPDHEVLAAALHADPGLFLAAELPRRKALRLPPFAAIALVSGEDSRAFVDALPRGLERAELEPARFLLRTATAEGLATGLAAAGAPRSGVRIEVDPVRI